MSIQNNDPGIVAQAMQENPSSQVTFPTRISDEVGRYEASTKLVNALGQEFDGAQIQVVLKNAEDIIKNALIINKESCLMKLTEKETIIFGAKVVTRRSTEYDYSQTPAVAKLESEVKELQEKIKKLKDQLKSLPAQEVVDTATGEIYYKAKLIKDGIVPAITLPR
jgi:vacuolar-type H+-ATPase subunit I/STV1